MLRIYLSNEWMHFIKPGSSSTLCPHPDVGQLPCSVKSASGMCLKASSAGRRPGLALRISPGQWQWCPEGSPPPLRAPSDNPRFKPAGLPSRTVRPTPFPSRSHRGSPLPASEAGPLPWRHGLASVSCLLSSVTIHSPSWSPLGYFLFISHTRYNMPCSWIGKCKIVKMSVFSNLILIQTQS